MPKKRLLFYLLSLPVGLVLVSLLLFYLATHPRKIFSGETPEKYGLAYEKISLASYDNTRLKAWYLPAKKPTDKAVLMLHGYPAEKGDLLATASLLEINFNILLVDLRSFGESGGKSATFGIREQKDAAAALDFLEKKGNTQIGVFGYSTGGAIGLLVAGNDPRIKAVASYAAFSDLKQLAENQYKNLGLLSGPMAEAVVFWSRLFYGPAPEPAKAAENMLVPALIIHNQGDEVVPFAQAQKLQAALRQNSSAEFYFPQGGSHNEPPLDFEIKLNYFFKTKLQ